MSLIKLTSKQRNGKAFAKDILIDLSKVAEPIIENVSNDSIISLVETPDVFNGTNKGNNKVQYIVDETLAAIVALSVTEMFIGTIVKRDGRNAVNSSSIFILSKVNGLIQEDALGSKFLYQEEGSLVPVEYIVSETPTQISVSTQLPIDVTTLGNSLFVSSQGKTIADGAVRESLTNHFSSLTEAVSAAQTGDTIYVYGGIYTNVGNLYKDGIIIDFRGYPTLSSSTTIFTDGGVAGTFTVRGNVKINSGSTKICDFSGVGGKVDLEFYSITTTGSQPLIFKDITNSRLKITDNFYVSSNTNCITFRGSVEMELIGNVFQHNAASTSSAFGLIYFEGNSTAGNFNGNVKITANKIISNGGRGGMVRVGSNDATYTFDGNIEVNCSNMDFNTVDTGNSIAIGIAAKVGASLNVLINGNVYTNKKAVHIFGQNGVNFTHYGKIVSTATDIEQSLISNQGTAYSSNVTYNLHGEYINNGVVRDVIRVDGGTGNIVNIDGAKVTNNYDSGAVTQTGVRITAASTNLRLNNVKIYVNDTTGAPESILTDAATDIRIYQGQAISNVAANVNITNLITGTSLIVDPQVL